MDEAEVSDSNLASMFAASKRDLGITLRITSATSKVPVSELDEKSVSSASFLSSVSVDELDTEVSLVPSEPTSVGELGGTEDGESLG